MNRFTEESPAELVQAMHAGAEEEDDHEPDCECRRIDVDLDDATDCPVHNPSLRRHREDPQAVLMAMGLAAVEHAMERGVS